MPRATGSMICPQCGKLIGVSEDRCPYCGSWRPGMWGWTPVLQRVLGTRVDLVGIVVRVCVVLYAAGLLLDLPGALRPSGILTLLSPSTRALYQTGMTGGATWGLGHWWTPFTAIYLHGGLLHIFFNLMWIRQLLPEVEEAYGLPRAFIIFTAAGVVGFLASNLVLGSPSVGASGSVFGMLAAAIVHLRRVGGAWAGLMARQMWQWAIVLFLMGFFMSGVNNLAHLGGFVGGFGASWWFSRMRGRPGRAALLACVGIAAITIAGFVASFVGVTALLLGSGR